MSVDFRQERLKILPLSESTAGKVNMLGIQEIRFHWRGEREGRCCFLKRSVADKDRPTVLSDFLEKSMVWSPQKVPIHRLQGLLASGGTRDAGL
jgi:hypothetical protein